VVTVHDVAARAGVSPRTVSNVVNGYRHVSAELRERVQQAIAETGYQPNFAARSLRRGRTGLIGLIIPEVDVPYFAELTRCFIDQLPEPDFTLVVDHTGGDPARERDLLLRHSRADLFDGLIANPLTITADELESAATRPLVLIGEQLDSPVFDHIMIDNVGAAREAVEHLLSRGCRRIALIGDEPDSWTRTTALRTQGYLEAHRDAGVRVRPELHIRTRGLHRRDGAAAMERLLELPERPDAVFCMNDLVALGALRTLATRGLRVPDDLLLIGFDDIEDGRFTTPTLSTVAPDKRQIAQAALSSLLRRMSGDRSAGQVIVADHALQFRESTGGPD
jgi:DNA-binding LacI/PurR family transcriptional regulator